MPVDYSRFRPDYSGYMRHAAPVERNRVVTMMRELDEADRRRPELPEWAAALRPVDDWIQQHWGPVLLPQAEEWLKVYVPWRNRVVKGHFWDTECEIDQEQAGDVEEIPNSQVLGDLLHWSIMQMNQMPVPQSISGAGIGTPARYGPGSRNRPIRYTVQVAVGPGGGQWVNYTQDVYDSRAQAQRVLDALVKQNMFSRENLRVHSAASEADLARHEREAAAKSFAKKEAALKRKEAAIDARVRKKSLLGATESLEEGARRRASTIKAGPVGFGPGYKKAVRGRAEERGRELDLHPGSAMREAISKKDREQHQEEIAKRASFIEAGDPPLALVDPWERLYDNFNRWDATIGALDKASLGEWTKQLLYDAANALAGSAEQADVYQHEEARYLIAKAKQKLLHAIPHVRQYGAPKAQELKVLEELYAEISQLEGQAYSWIMRHPNESGPDFPEDPHKDIAKRASMIEINPRRKNPDRGFLARARMFIDAEIKELKFRYERCVELGGQCDLYAKAIRCPWVERDSHVLECLHEIGHARTIPQLYKSVAFTSVRSETRALLWTERDAWIWALKAWKRLGGEIPLPFKMAEFVYGTFGTYVVDSKQDPRWAAEHLPDLRFDLAPLEEFLPMEPFFMFVLTSKERSKLKRPKPVMSEQDEIAARARMIELNPRSSFANGLTRYMGRR